MKNGLLIGVKIKIHNLVGHPIFFWVLLGMFIRIILGLYTVETGDTIYLYKAGMSVLWGNGIYDKPYMALPPVWIYIMSSFVKIGGLLFDPRDFTRHVLAIERLSIGMISSTVTSPAFNLIFKAHLLISDLLIGYILYKFVLEITGNINKSRDAFLLWYFNPLVLMVSAVHGRFDTLVALFLLLAVIFVYKKDYLLAGAMWMVGIQTKLAPVYFGPLLLGTLFSSSYNNASRSTKTKIKEVLKNISLFTLGSGLVFIIVSLPLFYEGGLSYSASAVTRRGETGIIVGGVSPWFIRHIPEYNWVFNWAYANPTIVMKYSSLTSLSILVVLGSIALLLGYRNPLKTLFYGSVATLSTVYLTSPIVNAQYLIWVFPFLIVVYTLFERGYKHLLSVITVSGLLFYFSLISIWHLMLPLAVYTNLLDVETIISATREFWRWGGTINVYLRDDLKLAAGFLGVLGIILCLFPKNISYSYIAKESVSELKRFIWRSNR